MNFGDNFQGVFLKQSGIPLFSWSDEIITIKTNLGVGVVSVRYIVIPTVAEESLLAGGIPRLHFISLGMTCMWLIVIEIKTLRNVFAGDDVQTFIYLTGIGG